MAWEMGEVAPVMKITVVGLGYVGSVAAACLADAGHDALGVDVDRRRVRALGAGDAPFYEPGLASLIRSGLDSGRLRFAHADEVSEPLGEAALVATGTPPAKSGAADLSQVRSALDWIEKARNGGDPVVVMKSTVPPGTGRGIVRRMGGGDGAALGYVSNPEFLREGRALADWRDPDRIVIGAADGDARSVEIVKRMHNGAQAPVLVTDVTSAEMIKYASNAFLATRISFINEMASLCDMAGASIDAVSEGLAMDARTGARIYAGVGYGGSCFPKDVRALDHLALTGGASVELLRSVISVNNRQRMMPLYALRRRFGGDLSGVRAAVMGLAFKPGTDDIRDAPAVDLLRALADEGASASAYDPRAMDAAADRLPRAVRLAESPEDAANGANAIALMTEWDEIIGADWGEIARRMQSPKLVYDGRNALDAAEMGRLGFEYVGVGRGG